MRAHFLIQAGHEGGVRNDGPNGSAPSSGTGGVPGKPPEITLTPRVSNAAVAELEAAGWSVIREDAFFDEVHDVGLAVAVHFNGPSPAMGASIGYPTGNPPGSNEPAADSWRAYYTDAVGWSWGWDEDNYSGNLSGYYGYGWHSTGDAEMVLEFGILTDEEQNDWLVPRVEWLGKHLARWMSLRAVEESALYAVYGPIGGIVPDPGPHSPPGSGIPDKVLEFSAKARADSVAAVIATNRARRSQVRLDVALNALDRES